jgi:hypothetical protein
MVPTKRLFIILFALIIASVAGAQTIPARLISDPVIRIPANWEFIYDINEVQTEIRVAPDSSAFLENIKDDKIELYDLVDTQIRQMQFTPMIVDSLAVEGVLLQSFRLETQDKGERVRKDFAFSRDTIRAWIKDEFVSFDTYSPLLQPSLTTNHLPNLEVYRHGYHYSGHYNSRYTLSNDGFGQPASVFGNALYLGYYDSFGRASSDLQTLSFAYPVYEQPVPIADIQAGLGDYEFKYARGSLKKNHLFDVENLYYSFDFLVQTGDWTEVFSDQTSTLHRMRIPFGKSILSLFYADYEQNISMTQLAPVYWQVANYTIDHKLIQYAVKLNTPYLDLAWRRSEERAKSIAFASSIKNYTHQFLGSKALQFANADSSMNAAIDLSYEKQWHETSTEMFNAEHADIVGLAVKASYQDAEISLMNTLYDYEDISVIGDFGYQYRAYKAGLLYSITTDNEDSYKVLPSINTVGDSIWAITSFTPQQFALYINKAHTQDLSFKAMLGFKNIINNLPYQLDSGWVNIKYDKTIAYASLNAQFYKQYGAYIVDLRQNLLWHDYDNDLRELPQYSYQTYAGIERLLPHNNSLFAGMGINGHSSYLVQNVNNWIVENSTILDLWGGFRITDMFELSVSFKNVLDGTIYGIYPIPQSVHASVRWFYLN